MSTTKHFSETLGWKTFMKYTNGIGAAIVILGALFKIMHYPGAGILLPVGMGVEVIIFLLSTLDAVHLDPDWSKVYPELSEDHGASSKAHFPPQKKVAAATPAIDAAKIGESLNNFSGIAMELSTLGGLSETANEMSLTMKKASSNIKQFSNSYEKSSHVLSESANILSESYQTAAQSVINYSEKSTTSLIDSGKKIADTLSEASARFDNSYTQIGRELEEHVTLLKDGNSILSKRTNAINSSMSNFATAQELQIKELARLEKQNDQFQNAVETFIDNVKSSSEETKNFKKGVTQLSASLDELNNIYGNMLLTINAYSKRK